MQEKKTIKQLREETQGALLTKLLILENKINNLFMSNEERSEIMFLIDEMRKLSKSYKKVLSNLASISFCKWHSGNYDKLKNIIEATQADFYQIWEKSPNSA